MDDALRDALVVEVGDLLPHDEVFEQGGPAGTGAQRILVVGDLHAMIGAQCLAGGIGAELYQLLEFLRGVRAIQGIGTGEFTLGGRSHGRSSSGACQALFASPTECGANSGSPLVTRGLEPVFRLGDTERRAVCCQMCPAWAGHMPLLA